MAIEQIVGGLAQTVGSFIGGRARRREQAAAREEVQRYKAAYQNLDTSNPYANITNPYEDLTVNTQAANFAAQQSAQGAANIMNTMSAAAGGSGIAALAQSLANSQAQQAQQASISIGQQEAQNQKLAMSGEVRRQNMMAQGEMQSRMMEQDKVETLLGMSMQRKSAADQARADATAATIGGVGSMITGLAGAAIEGDGFSNAGGIGAAIKEGSGLF